ncbi:MAG: GntR family transcriptional regulator [Dorea sp.]|uniref:GntR family transcriptional regulator n=1 Tax=Dorea sp. TaxID=2040332 RepID=UPI003991913B
MNGLKPIKMPSAKEKVAAELRKAILSRQMQEGEVLSLDSVATQLNVSAMPVREAFQILARDGLIQLRKNKGAVVLGITETYIKEHYQLRAILESSAAALAADPEADISEIESVYEEAAEALLEGNLRQYTDLNRAFHSEIWTAAGNQKMKNMISELWNGLSMGSMVSEEDYAKVSIKEHGNILKAIQKHDKEAAQKIMYDHIMRSRDDMLTYYK